MSNQQRLVKQQGAVKSGHIDSISSEAAWPRKNPCQQTPKQTENHKRGMEQLHYFVSPSKDLIF